MLIVQKNIEPLFKAYINEELNLNIKNIISLHTYPQKSSEDTGKEAYNFNKLRFIIARLVSLLFYFLKIKALVLLVRSLERHQIDLHRLC